MTPQDLAQLISTAVQQALAAQPVPAIDAVDMPHYQWIGVPRPHNKKWRVYFREAGDSKRYRDFTTENEAIQWRGSQRILAGGHPIGDELSRYLESKSAAASTLTTIRYRIESVIQDRQRIPVEAFPWAKAWADHVANSSSDTQIGTLSALRGFVKHLRQDKILRTDPLSEIRPSGRKKRGKTQGRVDEARRLVAACISAGDPAALALVTALTLGTRPGEVCNLRCRDLDANGSILWVDGEKSDAARRAANVPPELSRLLRPLAADQPRDAFLFRWTVQRTRTALDVLKARRDFLNRRLAQLCADVSIDRLTAHSLRGMHASFARARGATAADVVAMLGHRSYTTTERHYIAPGVDETRDAETVRGLLFPAVPHAVPSGTAEPSTPATPAKPAILCEDRESNPNTVSGASTSSSSQRWN